MTSAPTKSDKKKAISKRQARKHGLNPSNTWQQQPKIKSMTEREKAYLRNAGFSTKSQDQQKDHQQQHKVRGSINPQVDFINSPEYKFGRLLASPIARTRHATILKLKEYLKARTDPSNEDGGLSILDLMKLWKGMWHTLYLCDGAVVQEEVSKVLASLLWSVGGNQEEDEYAGRVYLEMEEEFHNDVDGDGDGDADGDADADDDDNEENEETRIERIEMEESDAEEIENEDNPCSDDRDCCDIRDHDHDEEGDEEEDLEEEDNVMNPAQEENVKHCRGAHLSALYVRTFFRTLTREWSNMDKYRIDKFYTLVRFILREIYRYMAARHWNLGIIRLFNDAIFEEVLRTNKYGNGIRFHILDITLDELAKVNSDKESTGLPLTEATFLDALEPYFALAQRVDDKMVQQRVMEKVLLKFLNEYSVVSDNYKDGDDDNDGDDDDDEAKARAKLVMDQVHVGTVGQFIFELASDTETRDHYRTSLYEMHKTYMKQIKTVGRDVSLMEEDDYDEEENGDNEKEEEPQEGDLEEEEEEEEEDKVQDQIPKKAQVEQSELEEAEKKKSKKKKKKKKNKKSNQEEEEEEEEEENGGNDDKPKAKQDDGTTLSQDKKRKNSKVEDSKRKKQEETKVADETALQPPNKKKKKNKKEKETKTKNHFTLTEEEEEVITISKKEQQAAAKAVLNAAKTIKAKEDQKQQQQHKRKKSGDDGRSKKVKFGDMNQSKSYKASMKDLKKLNPKAILEKTPEKSILLKKDKDKKRKNRH